MSFSDNLENDLKNLEKSDERDPATAARAHGRRQSERARAMAEKPHAARLKTSPFTAGLLREATRLGFGLRTKVHIIWIGTTLRLEAREHRMELRPAPEGVTAHWIVNGKEIRKEKVDFAGKPEVLAKRWLDSVGPPPPPPLVDPELE